MDNSKYIMFNIPKIQKYLNCGYFHAAKIFDLLKTENNFKVKIKNDSKYYLLPKAQEEFLYNKIYLYNKKLTENEEYVYHNLNKIDYHYISNKDVKFRLFKNNNFKKLLGDINNYDNTKPYLFPIIKNKKDVYFYNLLIDGNLFVYYKNKSFYNKFIQTLICSAVSRFSHFDIQFMLLSKEENYDLKSFENLKHMQNKITDKKLENVLYLKSIEHLKINRVDNLKDLEVDSIEEYNDSRFVKYYSKKKMPYVILIIEDIERFLESNDVNLKESILNILNYNKKYGIYAILSSNKNYESIKNLCNSVLEVDKNNFKFYKNVDKTKKIGCPFLFDKKDIKFITKYIPENN